MRQGHQPFVDSCTLLFYSAANDKMVFSFSEKVYVTLNHESGVRDNNEIAKTETLFEIINDRNHGVALMLHPIDDVVGQLDSRSLLQEAPI